MKQIVAVLLLILLSRGAHAGVGFSFGAEGATTLPGASLDGAVKVGADGDLYLPVFGGLAVLADAAADLRYLPAIAAVVASGGLSADVSLESGPWLTRFEIAGYGEASIAWGTAADAAPAGEASARLFVSWGGTAATVEGETALRLFGGDRIVWGPSIRVGLSGLLGNKVILSADTELALDVSTTGAAEPVFGVEVVAEWLADGPFVLRAVAALERRVSDASEAVVLDGVTLDVSRYWGYLELSSGVRMSVLLGRRMDLSLGLDGFYRLSDHGAITTSGILSESGWRVEIEPTLELGLDLSRRMALTLTAADRLALSNAATWSNKLTVGLQGHLALP